LFVVCPPSGGLSPQEGTTAASELSGGNQTAVILHAGVTPSGGLHAVVIWEDNLRLIYTWEDK